MKKLLIGLFIFGSLFISTQVHASLYSDALLKINNLTQEVNALKLKLGAVLYYSGTDGYTRSSYDYSGSGSGDALPSPVSTTVASVTPTTDLTPRISYWSGKVNQHVSVSEGMWQTDPDGSSGAGIDKLTYCKKWYPNTTSVIDYKNETINAWHDAGNVNDYQSTRLSFKCVDSSGVTPLAVPTLRVSLDSSTPSIQTITAGAGNVVFARIKVSADSQDVNNLNAIQIASNLPNATKLNNLAVYDGDTKIGSTNNGLTYNGTYYQSWIYLNNKLLIPANTSKVLSIVADTSPVGSTSVIEGDVRLGVAGWTFDYPGAKVSPFGTAIYGNTITINSSATPSITVISPNGGEVSEIGKYVGIKYEVKNAPADSWVGLTLYKDNKAVGYITLGANTVIPGDGNIYWRAGDYVDYIGSIGHTAPVGSGYSVEAMLYTGDKPVGAVPQWPNQKAITFDRSNGTFTIGSTPTPIIEPTTPLLKVLSPNGGESYKVGQQVTVRWKTNNIAYNPNTMVSIMDDRTPDWQTRSYFGSSPALNYAKLVSSNGSEYIYEYTFTVPSTFNDTLPSKYQNIYGGNHYKMLVNVVAGGTAGTSSQKVIEDYSDSSFELSSNGSVVCPSNGTPFIKVVTPNGGEIYQAGQQITVGWSSCKVPTSEGVLIEMIRADEINNPIGGGVNQQGWITLAESTPNDGFQTFTLDKNLIPGKYELAVKANFADDISDNLFTIKPATIVVSDCSSGLRYDSKTGMPCPIGIPVINTSEVKVYSPKGSDIFRQGLSNTISWTGGKNKVQAGLVSENYTGKDGILYGWIELNGRPNNMVTWNGSTLKSLDGSIISSVVPGRYKILVVSESEEGNYCSGSNSSDMGPRINCNFNLSNTFIIKPATINDTGCSNGALFNSNTGMACPVVTPTTVVDTGCSGGAIYSYTTGQACPTNTGTLAPIKRTLRQGTRGEDVKTLQEFLGLNADGVYGRGTALKVREWQIENGLNPDGSFGFMSRQKAGLVEN